MNSNFLSLVKIEIAKFLSSFRTGRKKKLTQTPTLYIALFAAILVAATSVTYSWLMLAPYIKLGVDTTPIVSLFAGIASLLIFTSSISQARGIYIGDDYDMLSAMPIKKRSIVASKIFSMYTIELVFAVLLLVPHGIMQIAYANSLNGLLTSLILAFTIPIVPIASAILISLLITIATARFKNANYFFVALYALIIIGIVSFSAITNNMQDAEKMNSFSSLGGILKWINPSYGFIDLYLAGQKLYMIAYVGVNVAVAILSILFLGLFFDKLHDIVSSTSMKKDYVRKDLAIKSPEKTLLGLEFKRLVNSKLYFVNTIMGSAMGIMASTIYLVSLNSAIARTAAKPLTPDTMIAILTMISILMPMLVALACMIIGLTNPITGSINIEGKNFWLIKSLPTDYKKYMKTKLRFAWILTIPACLIVSTIGAIFFSIIVKTYPIPVDRFIIELVALYIIPVVYIITNSYIGLIVALKHPKLKWSNESEAVKNAASVFIALLFDVIITIVMAAVLIIFPLLLPNLYWLGYLVALLIALLPAFPCYIYLNKNFSKRIQMIEDM